MLTCDQFKIFLFINAVLAGLFGSTFLGGEGGRGGGGLRKTALYNNFWLRKVRVVYAFKIYKNIYADVTTFLISSSNIDSTTGRSSEIKYFVSI